MSDPTEAMRQRLRVQQLQMRARQSMGAAPGSTTERVRENLARAQEQGLSPRRQAQQAEIDQQSMDQATLAMTPTGMAPALQFIRGFPFIGEYTDEIAGMMGSDADTQRVRNIRDAYGRENPGRALGAQIAGGIAGSVPLAGPLGSAYGARMQGAGLLQRMAAGGALGGATGAAEGAIAGYGAGDDGDRGQSAMQWGGMGLGIGGLLGAVLPAVGSGASAAYRGIREQVSANPSRIPGMSRTASDRVLAAATADGVDPARVARPGSMMADLGPATAGLLDEAVNTSPTGAALAGRAVGGRAAQASQTLQSTFDDVLGGPQGIRELTRTIDDATRPGIRAAYSQAYSTPIDYSAEAGRRIEDLITRLPARRVRQAVEMATDRMIYDGAPDPQILMRIGDSGSVTFEQLPNVMQLDYIKRAFDEIAQGSLDSFGRFTPEGQFANRIARDMADALGEAVPAYREALSTASDGFALRRATELGSRLLRSNTTREDVAEWAARATPVERNALALSLRSDIDERMAQVTRAVSDGNMDAREAQGILRAMSSRSARTKLEEALGPQGAGRIMDALDDAAQALELRASVATNSRTAGRAEGVRRTREALGSEPGQLGRDALSGRLLSSGRGLLESMAGNTPADRAARMDDAYREIAEYLTRSGSQAPALQGLLATAPQVQQQAINFGRNAATAVGLGAYPGASQSLRR
jgi:hypothetical protein